MAPTAEQVKSVERLVHESVGRVDAIAPEAMRALLPALRQARDELRKDLQSWLSNAPDGADRFTAYQRTQALRSLEASFERIAELHPAMAGALGIGRKETGAIGVQNLEHEVQRLSSLFGGGSLHIPQIDTAAVVAQGNKLLWKRHERSAARYAGGIGDDIRTRLAVSLAKGDTFGQTVQRLRGSADFKHAIAASDPGAAAFGCSDAMFLRWRHWGDRLVRTENMHAYNTQHDLAIEHVNADRHEDDDEYLRRWDATADKVSCDRCKALDRTVATIKGDFANGVHSPPLHPYCRCVVLAWLARWGNIKGEVPALHKGGDEEIQRPHESERERAKKIAENKAAAAQDLEAFDKHERGKSEMQAAKARQAKQLEEYKAKRAKPAAAAPIKVPAQPAKVPAAPPPPPAPRARMPRKPGPDAAIENHADHYVRKIQILTHEFPELEPLAAAAREKYAERIAIGPAQLEALESMAADAERQAKRLRKERDKKQASPAPVPVPDAKLEADKAAEAAARAILEKKNPKRQAAARIAAEASHERRREIHSGVATNLPQELQTAWAKEGHKFMKQEAPRIRGVEDRLTAASKLSEAFAEQYGSDGTTHEGDQSHKRREIEAKHAESWADEQERKYYERAHAEAQHSSQARHDEHETWGKPPKVVDDDDPPF